MEEENIVNMLEYNTHRETLALPEYGRGVHKMIAFVKTIEDREKRTRQARAVVRVMEILNPAVHSQENWEQMLWDHLFIMADYDLDIDAPYPVPARKEIESAPNIIPIQKKPIKASHYGRNIESIIELIAEKPDGEEKTAMIRDLAIYMRTQYLIWNKDSVSDSTIFSDIEKLSDGRVKVPEGMELSQLSRQASYNRPGMNLSLGQTKRNFKRGGRHGRK